MNYILKCSFENKVFVFNRNMLALQKFIPQNIKTFWGLSNESCLEKMNIEIITSAPGDNKNLCDQKWLNEIKKEYISEIENEEEQIRILNVISKGYTSKLKDTKDRYMEQVKKIIGPMDRDSIIKTIYDSRNYPVLKTRAENYKEFLKTGNIIHLLFSINPSYTGNTYKYLSNLGYELYKLLKDYKYLYKYDKKQSRVYKCVETGESKRRSEWLQELDCDLRYFNIRVNVGEYQEV